LNLSLFFFSEIDFSGRISIVHERKPSIYDFLQGYNRSYKDIETLMLQSCFHRVAHPQAKNNKN
jgi:hypothetical protein